ncbi:MAG: hypothetical protein A3E79_02870 [Burkholderiales bacterium RIFCSPHIGHO2_12_FULL_61_11]|nr:MAG: hypothetical protein A3E79_02870 [Burkholderiales bacterium RIFCSPHIGHO2_12_FULL_61_11]
MRLAAGLSFLAVLSALWAPVSMLAEEVRTGQLGGLCSATAASASNPDAPGDSPQIGLQCDLCGTIGLILPPLVACAVPSFAGYHVAVADTPANLATAIPGLPFSRGPPAAL